MQNGGVKGHHVVRDGFPLGAEPRKGQAALGVLDLAAVQSLVDLLKPVVRDPAAVGESQGLHEGAEILHKSGARPKDDGSRGLLVEASEGFVALPPAGHADPNEAPRLVAVLGSLQQETRVRRKRQEDDGARPDLLTDLIQHRLGVSDVCRQLQ